MLNWMLLSTCCDSLLQLCQSVSHSVNHLTVNSPIHARLHCCIGVQIFKELHPTISTYRAPKHRHSGPQCRPFGRNTGRVRNEKSWDDICFTPKWVCSHAVDSFRSPPFPSFFPSQWWTWSSPPSLLPVILAFQARRPVRGPAKAGNALVLRPRGRMLVREFGSMECKERASEKWQRDGERLKGEGEEYWKQQRKAGGGGGRGVEGGQAVGPNSKRPREKTHLVKSESLKLLSV